MPYPLPIAAPTPEDTDALARMQHTALRRRVMEGRHEHDVRGRYVQLVGPTRARQHKVYTSGAADLTSNVLRSYSSSQSTLYDRPVSFDHADGLSGRLLTTVLRNAGHQSYMQRVQRDCIALREMLVAVEVTTRPGSFRVHLRPVAPDLVEAWADPHAPDVPVRIREAIPREIDGSWQFVYHDVSIDPDRFGVYRKVVDRRGRDLSPRFLRYPDGRPAPVGGFRGDAYIERDSEGRPVLPFVLYHAARTGHLFDPWQGIELVEGTLNVGVLRGMWQHIVRDASWPQRVVVDGQPMGFDTVEGDVELTTDPAAVMVIETATRLLDGGGGRASIAQWQPGADAESLQRAIDMYERRLYATAGLAASDVQRESGDPRSGYALAVNRSAQRAAQAAYRPTFERGDAMLARIVAVLLNRAVPGLTVAEGGYEPTYQGIPLDGDELDTTTSNVLSLLQAEPPLMTHRQALRRIHADLSDAQIDRLAAELATSDTNPRPAPSGREDT
jgi:hypothetical protein